MARWYRALVVFMAAAMTLCTVGMAYAGFELWQSARRQETVWTDDSFCWSNGLYDVNGRMRDGVLQELTVRRAQIVLEDPS